MIEQSRINESNLKKINRFNLKDKVYKTKLTNPSEGYQKTKGLKTSDEARQILGSKGVHDIGSEIITDKNKAGVEGIKVSDATISTGGGDPLPKGSHDNEFLVAENAEEAEELRERTDGEVPVRTLQYRNSEGQFSDSPDKVQRKLKDNARDNSREYFKNKSGLTDEEFEEKIKSLGMTKDDFVYQCLNNIEAVSKGLVDKKALMHHLRHNEGLSHGQSLQIYGDRKYGRKDNTFSKRFSDEQHEKGNIKIYQTINENRAKANNRSNVMKKAWRKRKQSDAMKERQEDYRLQNEKQNSQQNKYLNQEGDLSGYTSDEIAQARKEIFEYNKGTIPEEFITDRIIANYLNSKKGG